MLVLSKMKQKLSRNMLKLYNSVPVELKQEFNRRRKEFVKNNTLKLWKKFLIDLYDKQSRRIHLSIFLIILKVCLENEKCR